LLLAAPRLPDGLQLSATGDVPSRPHIDMTVASLRERGVQVDDDGDQGHWMVHPGPICGGEMWVEPDLSNAAPFLAAALVVGGSVTVPGWPVETTQPGAMVPDLLKQMGPGPVIKGLDIDLSAAGELVPTFAALAALADTPSRFTGIGHLRGHETDRLAALVTEINLLGGDARELPDGIEINPAELHGGVWHTYDDHRMATAGAIIGLRVPGVKVENIETTAKTLPDFAQMWDQMLTDVAGEAQ
jgi:3-phosphoshikimate 1-carboxyvinyltransferase